MTAQMTKTAATALAKRQMSFGHVASVNSLRAEIVEHLMLWCES
jgi:hypothetical protein